MQTVQVEKIHLDQKIPPINKEMFWSKKSHVGCLCKKKTPDMHSVLKNWSRPPLVEDTLGFRLEGR